MEKSTHLQQFRLMAQYNTWVNHHLYELARSLADEERRRDCGAFFGSIHGTLNHLLVGDRAWLGRFATSTPYTFAALEQTDLLLNCTDLSQELYPNFEQLWQGRSKTDQAIEQWIEELTPAMLSASMHYRNVSGTIDRTHALWFGIAHFFNHQTHHRAQVTVLLQQMGKDYGMTDFLVMYNLARAAVQA